MLSHQCSRKPGMSVAWRREIESGGGGEEKGQAWRGSQGGYDSGRIRFRPCNQLSFSILEKVDGGSAGPVTACKWA